MVDVVSVTCGSVGTGVHEGGGSRRREKKEEDIGEEVRSAVIAYRHTVTGPVLRSIVLRSAEICASERSVGLS